MIMDQEPSYPSGAGLQQICRVDLLPCSGADQSRMGRKQAGMQVPVQTLSSSVSYLIRLLRSALDTQLCAMMDVAKRLTTALPMRMKTEIHSLQGLQNTEECDAKRSALAQLSCETASGR